MSTSIERQNQVIISLLARSAIGVGEIEKMVRKGKKKQNSDSFVRAYNALDGQETIAEVAKTVGLTKEKMLQLLQMWEEKGIVYDVGTSKRTAYVGLLKLPIKAKGSNSGRKGKGKKKLKNGTRGGVKSAMPSPETFENPPTNADAPAGKTTG